MDAIVPTSPAADKTKMDGSVAEVGPGACPQGNTTNLSLVVVSACGRSASVCKTLGHRPTPKCRKLPLASTAASRYAIMAATEDSLCRRATACQHSFRTVPADRGKAAANDCQADMESMTRSPAVGFSAKIPRSSLSWLRSSRGSLGRKISTRLKDSPTISATTSSAAPVRSALTLSSRASEETSKE